MRTVVFVDMDCFSLEYEGLSMIYFGYGKFGHNKDECKKGNELEKDAKVDNETGREHLIIEEPLPYDPWMQVANSRG